MLFRSQLDIDSIFRQLDNMRKASSPGKKADTQRDALSLLGKLDKLIAEKSVNRVKQSSIKKKDKIDSSVDSGRSNGSSYQNQTIHIGKEKLKVKFNESFNQNSSKRSTESKGAKRELDKLKNIVNRSFSKTSKPTQTSAVKNRILDLSRGSHRSDHNSTGRQSFLKTTTHGLKQLSKTLKDDSTKKRKSPLDSKSFYIPGSITRRKNDGKMNKTIGLPSLNNLSYRDNSLNNKSDRIDRVRRKLAIPNEAVKTTPKSIPIKTVILQPVPISDYRFKVELKSSLKAKTSKSPTITRISNVKQTCRPPSSVSPKPKLIQGSARREAIHASRLQRDSKPSHIPPKTNDSSINNMSSYIDKSAIPQVSTTCKLPSVNSSNNHSDFVDLQTFNQSECGDDIVPVDCMLDSRRDIADDKVDDHDAIQLKIALLLEREKKISRVSQLSKASKYIRDRPVADSSAGWRSSAWAMPIKSLKPK